MRLQSTFVAAALCVVLIADMAKAQALPQKDLAPAADPSTQASHVHLGGAVHDAKLIHQVPPTYPADAKRDHVEGTVVLHAIVTKDGSVDQLQVVSGPAALTDAAIAAVKHVARVRIVPHPGPDRSSVESRYPGLLEVTHAAADICEEYSELQGQTKFCDAGNKKAGINSSRQ